MQRLILILVAVALVAIHCDALSIGIKREATETVSSPVVAMFQASEISMSAEDEMTSDGLNPDLMVRPNAGKGTDKVKFGLRAMNFYGTDMKHHTFSIDVVMSIRWNDTRVVELIPDGLDNLTMARADAEKVMWMPGIIVSNRDIEKYEIISASVSIDRTGEVRRVERANARCMKRFLLEEYPFDSQTLAINIASSKYMLDEVTLVPDEEPGAGGVEEAIWGLYQMRNWSTFAYEALDGDLKKSRGTLNILVERSLDKYSQDHLLPGAIVLMISWAVFYFPFANPFITARLMLSILALLTFTGLIIKSTKELPGAAPFNWNDLLNQQIQTIMFLVIVINIATDIWFHTFQNEKVARRMNHECKMLIPFISIANISVIMIGGSHHLITLGHATFLTKALCIGILGTCVGSNAYGLFGLADAIENATPRSDRQFDKVTQKERPPPFAMLSLATLTIAMAFTSKDADDDDGDDCDM